MKVLPSLDSSSIFTREFLAGGRRRSYPFSLRGAGLGGLFFQLMAADRLPQAREPVAQIEEALMSAVWKFAGLPNRGRLRGKAVGERPDPGDLAPKDHEQTVHLHAQRGYALNPL
jgi:hypothetical protein